MSDSECEIVLQARRPRSAEIKHGISLALSELQLASPALRRGTRPRTRPKSYATFFETSPQKSSVARRARVASSESEQDDPEYQHKTATSLFTSDDIEGQHMFRFKSRHTKLDLQNKVSSAVLNSPKTTDESTPRTPKRSRLSIVKGARAQDTPKHVTNIIKKRIINEVESDHTDSDFSGSSSDFIPEKENDESSSPSDFSNSEEEGQETPVSPVRKPSRVQLRRTDGRKLKKDTEYVVRPDSYFMMHGSKKITTSDHTLERLKNYNPADAQINIDHLTKEHKTKIQSLNETHRHLFNKWLYVLGEDYSVLLYGVGSKRNILQEFQSEKLKNFPCVVVNGFFPSLTMKSVLEGIVVDLLQCSQVPGNNREAVSLIDRELREQDLELFLIVHNIDGEMLRGGKAQSLLAGLAQIRNVRLIATIDHINAPLIWDQTRLSRFNFTWWDATSLLPYSEETSYENSLLAHRSGALQLSSLRSVYQSLTTNARGIFNIIIDYQLAQKTTHYQGLPIKDLYSLAREQFLVSSDVALRAQLTEFLDHKLVRARRSADGSELLLVPLDNGLLQQFLDQQN